MVVSYLGVLIEPCSAGNETQDSSVQSRCFNPMICLLSSNSVIFHRVTYDIHIRNLEKVIILRQDYPDIDLIVYWGLSLSTYKTLYQELILHLALRNTTGIDVK